MEVYSGASGAPEKDEKKQTAIILNCAGPHVLEIYDNLCGRNPRTKTNPLKF